MDASTIRQLPHIEAALGYIEPTRDKPRSLEYAPPPGVPDTTAVHRDYPVTIRDVRPVASALSLIPFVAAFPARPTDPPGLRVNRPRTCTMITR
jgi:hypothetical protein